MIYQELSLAGEMSVAENIFLGREPVHRGLIDWPAMSRKSSELLSRFRLEIDPDMPVRRLGIGQQQLIEIAKALGMDEARVLILDEPTAALSEHEVERLLGILRELRAQGTACLYISHKLDEVFAISDRITVLRDGKSVFTSEASQTSQAEVVKNMVGRELGEYFPRHTPILGEPVLTVEHLTVARPDDGKVVLNDIRFAVRAGRSAGHWRPDGRWPHRALNASVRLPGAAASGGSVVLKDHGPLPAGRSIEPLYARRGSPWFLKTASDTAWCWARRSASTSRSRRWVL